MLTHWKVTLFAVSATLAGCLSVPPLGWTSDGPGPQGEQLLFRSTIIDQNRSGSEPSLIVAPDGSIFVCSPKGIGAGTDVWLSVDDGASFRYIGEEVDSSAPPFRSGSGDVGGGDCDLGVDAGGRIYLVDLAVASVSVSSSNDHGKTWRGTPVSFVSPPSDRPWVLGGKPDEVFVTAAQTQGFGWEDKGLDTPPVGGIWVVRSTDGGATFPQRTLAVENGRRIGFNSNLAMNGDNLYLMYTQKVAEGKLAIMVAASRDRGMTWEQLTVAEQEFYPGGCFPITIFPVIGADSSGGVYLAWVLQNPETERADLFFTSSPDGGRSWNPPYLVTSRPGTRSLPWLAVGDSGHVGLSWYENNLTKLLQFTPDALGKAGASCEEGMPEDAGWFLRYAFSSNALKPNPRFEETIVQPEPIHKGELGRPFSEFFQLRFDSQGRAMIAYLADVPEGEARPMFAIQTAGPQGFATPTPSYLVG